MNRDLMLNDATTYLDDNYYDTHYAFKYVDASIQAKESFLVPILRRHPMWNEERGFISFVGQTERRIDYNNLVDFKGWVDRISYKYGMYELDNNRYFTLFDNMLYHMVHGGVGQYPDDKIIKIANQILTNYNKGHITKDTKNSKIVGRLAPLFGIDKIKDMQTISWTDPNTGEVREKEKDFGWNYWFALFCDSINPIRIDRRITLSVSPLSFLAMSNGYKWESCHNICRDGSGEEAGCYSGGTMSYGLDKNSMILFYTDKNSTVENVEFEKKLKRCMFFWGEDKLIQSRVYPDGRDGGDFGISEEMRNIVREIISNCLGFPNLWQLKQGYEKTKVFISSKGVQYPDYIYYNDVNTSLPWTKPLNYKKIEIGRSPICPSCGQKHRHESSILCERCSDDADYYCDRCDTGFSEYSDYILTDDGHRYCCAECAERDGYVYTFDTNEWVYEDNVYYDNYVQDYFQDDYDMVETEDGHVYHTPYNAERDGYIFTDDTEVWIKKRNAYELVTGEFYEYEPEIVINDDYEVLYYASAEDAEKDGWVFIEEEWVRKEEMLNEAV